MVSQWRGLHGSVAISSRGHRRLGARAADEHSVSYTAKFGNFVLLAPPTIMTRPFTRQIQHFLFVPLLLSGLLGLGVSTTDAAEDRLVFLPPETTQTTKHIVLIAGDEEYRSEETMPMLGKILSQRHGFRCTVLFSFGPDGAAYIDPNHQAGLRGMEALDDADLMLIGTRFRRPSAAQAMHVTRFLSEGKPVIGIRTATHAFQGSGSFGDAIPYGQFGRLILGEQWVSHHGAHKRQGARSVLEPAAADHPILRSVDSFFAPSDVYGVVNLTDQDQILLRGAVTETLAPDSAIVQGKINDPMQPLAWLHRYTCPDGVGTGTAFCTTAGAAVDFVDEHLRRLIVNAVYYLTDQEVPLRANVDFVDPFYPPFFGFIRDKDFWPSLNRQPSDYGLGKSPITPDPPGSPVWPYRDRPIDD